MSFTHNERQTIFNIHRDVMNVFTYVEDIYQYRLSEFWEGDDMLLANMREPGRRFGDCDEFAIEFMKRCMAKKLDARLIHAVVYNQFGHLITEVATRNRDEALYLDNRFYRPVAFYELNSYTLLNASPWNPQRGEKRPWMRLTGIGKR